MSTKFTTWKRGRGKLGALDPLLGAWSASMETLMGHARCVRTFAHALNGAYGILDAEWDLQGKKYLEHAIYGVGESGVLTFWSFTSDGKRPSGTIFDVSEIHPSAIGFEAQMPAGLARMIYWPAEDGGFRWAVESKSKKGWKRFTERHYRAL